MVILLSITGVNQLSELADFKFKAEVEKNFFNGLPGSNNQILVVKIDDSNPAHPQIGVEDADLVYVEQVEGGITRLAAIYTSKLPPLIGPVRSARISDLEILSQFGRVGFAYSGAQSKMRPVIAAANLENLSAERNPPSIYGKDPNRPGPVNMILKPDLLLDRANSNPKIRIDTATTSPFIFGETSVRKFLQKIGITAAYGLFGFCFGPKILKYRKPIISKLYVFAKISPYNSLVIFETA